MTTLNKTSQVMVAVVDGPSSQPGLAVVVPGIQGPSGTAFEEIPLNKLAAGALPASITVASANIVDGTIVNADVSTTAAIAGSKIVPQFGSQAVDSNSLASLANLMFAFAARGASIGEPGKLLFGVGPAVTGTTPVGIGPHDYYPIDLATGSFM
jgi:hypothetical protein